MAYLDDNGLLYFWQAIKNLLAGKQAKITANGMLKGDGSGGVTAAVAGTDYLTTHQDISGKLDKSGGTMTGKLTLDGAPTSNLHAATKKYVDDSVPSVPSAYTSTPEMDGTGAAGSSSAYAKGDHVHPTDTSRQAKVTASGILKGDGSGGVTAAVAGTDYIASHQDISGKLDKSGGTMTGKLTLDGAPSSNLHAATKKYVDDSISTAISGAASFQGEVNSQSAIEASSYKAGWYWVVGTAGTYVGQTCEVGDQIYAKADKGSSYSASDFNVIQVNLTIVAITNAEIDTILAS